MSANKEFLSSDGITAAIRKHAAKVYIVKAKRFDKFDLQNFQL